MENGHFYSRTDTWEKEDGVKVGAVRCQREELREIRLPTIVPTGKTWVDLGLTIYGTNLEVR